MSSSDDDAEAPPQEASSYFFYDEKDEPVSFSELPVQWNENESPKGEYNKLFLRGAVDNGLQKIYKQIIAWKFDISGSKPEISVLSKENNWIKLEKPRKSYEETIRSILITVQCLHFVKKNPETDGRALWDQLSKIFSLYEVKPSENDLVDHMNLIEEAVKRDEELAKSKFLVTLLEDKPSKRKNLDQNVEADTKSSFIVADDAIDEMEEDQSDEEEEDLFDSVCAICDNGGEILCCEGRCLRSFHATVESGRDSDCKSLGLSNEQVEAIQNFFCKNCQYKQHQCSACGQLGSSDKTSGAEVFPCVSATCGRFYHPHCVAKLLHRDNEADAEELRRKVAAGESFTCPVHKCCVCKQGENKLDAQLQFAICRRCPKSYHRKCLPRKIAFEEDSEDEEIEQRAWEGLIPNRILIYCLRHKIDEELGTPVRNHIKFPDVGEKKKKQASELSSSRQKLLKKRSSSLDDGSGNRTVTKPTKEFERVASSLKQSNSFKKGDGKSPGLDSLMKQKPTGTTKRTSEKGTSLKVNKSTTDGKRPSLGDRLYYYSKGLEPPSTDSGREQTPTKKPIAKESSSLHVLDADSKRSILALAKNAASSITLEEVMEKHKGPSTHAYSSRNVVDKTITLGKVEGSIEAVREALHKLEEGCSIEDAKAVCEPGLLNQILKWKNKLKVYISPFLYGMRYTSFGRHFTKVDKLKEIVDRVRWYIQEGDMIVDFCCGANDFSCLMKEKLDEMGKKCSYKNFDLLQAKNDFCFEKRDWMRVRTDELPKGSQLIMGLNPPFGTNAALANKFIDKALTFKPKLIVLIVPQETQRLDEKNPKYDLVWEDDELLFGKSFYLPGSVDINDKQMEDWNVNPPPLYLWSRPDWTSKHKAIAQKQGHLSRVKSKSPSAYVEDIKVDDPPKFESPMIVEQPSPVHVQTEIKIKTEQRQERSERVTENVSIPEKPEKPEKEEKPPAETSNRDNSGKRKRENGQRETTRVESQTRKNHHTTWTRSPPRSPPRPVEHPPPQMEVENRYSHEGVSRRYSFNRDEPYSSGNQRWSIGSNPTSGYGMPNSDGPFPGYGNPDRQNYPPNSDDPFPGYGNPDRQNYPPYYKEMERDPLTQRGGFLPDHEPGLAQRSGFLPDHEPGPGFSSAPYTSYGRTNASTMQRYAPRLDELNPMRMNNLGPNPPTMSRSGFYDPRPPLRPGVHPDTLGFAPGPYHSYSQHNSSGWLNE